MDTDKRDKLVTLLSSRPEPQLVAIQAFFDGNDDLGSIGCNLLEHPGIEVFRSTLVSLLDRDDIDAVYAQITELEPGRDSWPFTDTVLVVGSISTDDLAELLQSLEPDEVDPVTDVPPLVAERHQAPVHYVWWD